MKSRAISAGAQSPTVPRRRQEVVAGDEAIGEVLEVVRDDGVTYLHVLRYGPGFDELYIPTMAIKRVVGDHVYIDLRAADLVGQPWHERPTPLPSPQ